MFEWKKFEAMTPEKLKNMSHEEIMRTLKSTMQKAKSLPNTPEKTFIVKMGKKAILIEELKNKFELTDNEEEKKAIDDQMRQAFEEAMVAMRKVMVLMEADHIKKEHEIEMQREEEDCWEDDSSKQRVVPVEKVIEKKPVDEYDPWATAE